MEPGENEELEQVSRELRERVGGEFRLAAEEDEYWAMKQARRAASLSEFAYDAMSRGDRVEIWAGESRLRGYVQHTRTDLLTLRANSNVDVNLGAPIVLRVIEPAAAPGAGASPQGPESFAARMAELEQTEEIYEFITPFSKETVIGRVAIRARDHLVVEDSGRQEWIIPLMWLMAVVNR